MLQCTLSPQVWIKWRHRCCKLNIYLIWFEHQAPTWLVSSFKWRMPLLLPILYQIQIFASHQKKKGGFLHLPQLCSWLENILPSALAQNLILKYYTLIRSSLLLILISTNLNKSQYNFHTKLEATHLRCKSRFKDCNNAY